MASKRRIRRRSCEKKRRHETEESAWGQLRALNKKDVDKMNVYPCTFGGKLHWHVGHRPR